MIYGLFLVDHMIRLTYSLFWKGLLISLIWAFLQTWFATFFDDLTCHWISLWIWREFWEIWCPENLQLLLHLRWSGLSLNIIVNMEGILGGMTSRKLAVRKINARLSFFFKVTYFLKQYYLTCLLSHIFTHLHVTLYVIYLYVRRRRKFTCDNFLTYLPTYMCDIVYYVFIRWEERKIYMWKIWHWMLYI